MPLATLTPEQREQALRKAVESRKATSAARAELKAGRIKLADVLEGKVPALQRAKVHAVLTTLPGVGKATADRALAEAGVAEGRRVKGLGDRQRKALTERFAA